MKQFFFRKFMQISTFLKLLIVLACINSFACQGMNKPSAKRKNTLLNHSTSYPSNKMQKIKNDSLLSVKKSTPQHTFFLYPEETFQPPTYLKNTDFQVVCMRDEKIFNPINTFNISSTHVLVPNFLIELKRALDRNDIFSITKSFDDLIKLIPKKFQIQNHNEGFYHSLIHTFLRFTNYNVCSDIPTGSGEADTYIRTAHNIYLFEFKINEKNAHQHRQKTITLNALKQIFENDYYKQNHQDDVPMTLAAISFHGTSNQAKIKDSFSHLSCASLELKKDPSTLRTYPFAQPTKPIGDHNEAPSLCTDKNWNILHVQQYSFINDSEQFIDEPYSQIDTYHENLKNIHLALKKHNVPLIVKNIDCILHAIPWSLRKFNQEYFQAIIYTSLLCSGNKITFNNDDNIITLKTPKYKYKFICSYRQQLTSEDALLLLKKLNERAETYTVITEKDAMSKPKIFIFLNVNQPIVGKSKIQLMGHGFIIKNHKICNLDGKTIDPLLDQDLASETVISSPRTNPRVAKQIIPQDPPLSPYQPPRNKNLFKNDIH